MDKIIGIDPGKKAIYVITYQYKCIFCGCPVRSIVEHDPFDCAECGREGTVRRIHEQREL
jgi:DNA-directed RNA polymerase subunit RPC12/RpoP